jgi:hypothetical protein
MDEGLARAYRAAIFERLDYLDRLAAKADLRSRAALAQTEIARMSAALRSVLTAHQPDEEWRCPQCSGRRRPRPFPCATWTAVHRHLIHQARR